MNYSDYLIDLMNWLIEIVNVTIAIAVDWSVINIWVILDILLQIAVSMIMCALVLLCLIAANIFDQWEQEDSI